MLTSQTLMAGRGNDPSHRLNVPSGRSRHLSLAVAGSELHRLCRTNDLSAIRSYLNETLTETVVNRVAGLNGCTPLHEAAMAGKTHMLYVNCLICVLSIHIVGFVIILLCY